MAEVSLELLHGLMQRNLHELAGLRREQTEMRCEQAGVCDEQGETRRGPSEIRRQNDEMRSHLRPLATRGRRIERKPGDVRDGVELLVKLGLMVRLGHPETHIAARLDTLAPHVT